MTTAKPVEIFCGTGGVGKTTLASSRALYLASNGRRVLLITIDPSRRLKQVLGLDDNKLGEAQKVNFEGHVLDALLLSPRITLSRLAKIHDNDRLMSNPIINILTRPYGGMNEIMAVLEVQHHLENKNYDTIILDTPPGKHFVDFLKSTQKINKFFDRSFVEIFKYLGKSFGEEKGKKNIISMIISSGVKKLLGYLEKVTGQAFVGEFVDAIAGLYQSRDSFLAALRLEESFKKVEFCNWFLVTSASQNKYREAQDLAQEAKQFMHSDKFLLLNKCIRDELESWQIDPSMPGYKLKQTMIERENQLMENAKRGFDKIYQFPDVPQAGPEKHIQALMGAWT
jgi:anion-transporting  ArsA/GET3 family ATPase